MIHNMQFETQRLIVRPLTMDTIEYARILRNTYKDCFFYNKEISPQEQVAWFEKYRQTPEDRMFVAYLKTHPELPVGVGAVLSHGGGS